MSNYELAAVLLCELHVCTRRRSCVGTSSDDNGNEDVEEKEILADTASLSGLWPPRVRPTLITIAFAMLCGGSSRRVPTSG